MPARRRRAPSLKNPTSSRAEPPSATAESRDLGRIRILPILRHPERVPHSPAIGGAKGGESRDLGGEGDPHLKIFTGNKNEPHSETLRLIDYRLLDSHSGFTGVGSGTFGGGAGGAFCSTRGIVAVWTTATFDGVHPAPRRSAARARPRARRFISRSIIAQKGGKWKSEKGKWTDRIRPNHFPFSLFHFPPNPHPPTPPAAPSPASQMSLIVPFVRGRASPGASSSGA